MAANRKFLFAFAVFVLFLFSNSQNIQAKVYEWNDFKAPFQTEIKVDRPAQISVDLPEGIIKNNKQIPLLVKNKGLGRAGTGTVTGVVLINNMSSWRGHGIGDYPGEEVYEVLINTRDLKAGQNIITFKVRARNAYRGYYSITELRFDLSEVKGIQPYAAKSPPSKPEKNLAAEGSKQNITPDQIPPTIVIISHDTTRGIRPVENQKKVTIRGRVTDESGIVEIMVNSRDVVFNEAGNFEADVYLKIGDNRIDVTAMDVYENRAIKAFTIKRVAPQSAAAAATAWPEAGRYYALVIGNNNYQYLRKLTTAQKDAKAVAATLSSVYGFDTRLHLDADREVILDALNGFRRKLQRADLFLIYYAGHGAFDKTANKAYWLPVDAQRDNDKNWIIVDTITSNIKRISSKHVLIVADSCYSGTFTRRSTTDLGTGEKRSVYLDKMLERKSRTLLASGGNEPVSDIGGQGHSVFARAFLYGLNNIGQERFTAEELYISYIKEMVAGSSEQIPEYNVIRNSGHQGGDFVFRKRLE